MTTVGAAWKRLDKNSNKFISVTLDKALLPLTIDNTKRLALFPVKEKPSDKSPDFRVDLYVPEEKEENEPKTDLWD